MKEANANDKQRILDILTKAFNENRSVNYVVKQDNHREKRIRGLMEYSYNVCEAFGEVWISENKEACALVLFPDQKRFTKNAILWDAKLALNVIGLSRVNSILKRESKVKSHHPSDPFSYLWFIGVNPDHQGKGIGSKLLTEVIEQCERTNRPIYLETSVQKNLSWYKKFGFEIFHSLDLTYQLYLLRRQSS